jgi:hypothetical protein
MPGTTDVADRERNAVQLLDRPDAEAVDIDCRRNNRIRARGGEAEPHLGCIGGEGRREAGRDRVSCSSDRSRVRND